MSLTISRRVCNFLSYNCKYANYMALKFSTKQKENENISEEKIPEIRAKKVIKFAVIGVPNAGKSTFINSLIDHRVCPTSNKVHTTRKSNKAIYTVNDTQIILFDTPGLVTEKEIKKYNLESSFKISHRDSIKHGHMIAVVHDASNSWTRDQLHSTVLDTLNAYPSMSSILILNKIDCFKSKRILLELVKKLTQNKLSGKKLKMGNDIKDNDSKDDKPTSWPNFSNVFMVSSLMGDGLQDVLHFLLKKAESGDWEYPSNVFTDQSPEDLIVQSVRARLLDYMPQEIPYTLKSELEYFNEEKGMIYASVQVVCPNSRIEKLLCGESNGKLKQITERVSSDLVETFGKPVSLTIITNVGSKTPDLKS